MQLNLGLKFFPLPTLSYAHYYLIVMILMGIAAKRGLKCWSHEVNYFTLERICSRYYSILVFCFCGIQTKIASQPQRDFPNSTFMTSVTRSWPKRSEISTKKNSQSSLYLKKVTLSKQPKKLPNIWATLEKIIVTKNFQKSPNLVTLVMIPLPRFSGYTQKETYGEFESLERYSL